MPHQCVRNFSDACGGKAEEREQIEDNRNRTDLRIVGSTLFGSPRISLRTSGVDATFTQRCQFEDVEIRLGRRWRVDGDCFLTAVYENWRWWLCTSNFFASGPPTSPFGFGGPSTRPSEREFRAMAPGTS